MLLSVQSPVKTCALLDSHRGMEFLRDGGLRPGHRAPLTDTNYSLRKQLNHTRAGGGQGEAKWVCGVPKIKYD